MNLEGTKYDFLPSCFIVNDIVEQRNTLKQAWLKIEVPIYLCAFHVLKNWKNHIWTKISNLGTLKDLVYWQLHSFLYMPIEYQNTKTDFLKRACVWSKTMFKFLYIKSMEEYIEVHYDHQGEFLFVPFQKLL